MKETVKVLFVKTNIEGVRDMDISEDEKIKKFRDNLMFSLCLTSIEQESGKNNLLFGDDGAYGGLIKIQGRHSIISLFNKGYLDKSMEYDFVVSIDPYYINFLKHGEDEKILNDLMERIELTNFITKVKLSEVPLRTDLCPLPYLEEITEDGDEDFSLEIKNINSSIVNTDLFINESGNVDHNRSVGEIISRLNNKLDLEIQTLKLKIELSNLFLNYTKDPKLNCLVWGGVNNEEIRLEKEDFTIISRHEERVYKLTSFLGGLIGVDYSKKEPVFKIYFKPEFEDWFTGAFKKHIINAIRKVIEDSGYAEIV